MTWWILAKLGWGGVLDGRPEAGGVKNGISRIADGQRSSCVLHIGGKSSKSSQSHTESPGDEALFWGCLLAYWPMYVTNCDELQTRSMWLNLHGNGLWAAPNALSSTSHVWGPGLSGAIAMNRGRPCTQNQQMVSVFPVLLMTSDNLTFFSSKNLGHKRCMI